MTTNCIFLTGATGTVGSALVPVLLQEPRTSVVALIRARDEGDLHRRACAMFDYWSWGPGDERRARFKPLLGDVSLPKFGLAAREYAQLAQATTNIVHGAASVKLNMPMDEATRTAVLPTRNALALAREAAREGVLRKVELVSTVGVWGRSAGVMPERALPEVRDFHNTYEAAKAEAERIVWAEAGGLPITLHRPSMVVGDALSGRVIHFQVFYHLCEFLAGTRTYGIMPELGVQRLDTTPVDWVSKAIAWSVRTPQSAGLILHLCSGPTGSMQLCDLQQLVRAKWLADGRRVPRLRRVSAGLLARMVPAIGAIAGARVRRALRGLPPVLAYLAEDQAFSNDETSAMLAAADLPVPDVASYIGPVLDYYLENTPPGARS